MSDRTQKKQIALFGFLPLTRAVAGVLAFFLFAAAAQAGVIYNCELKNRASGGWMGHKIFFEYDPVTDKGLVLDWAAARVHDGPVAADTKGSNNKALRFRWRVEGNLSDGGHYSTVSYVAVLNLSSMRVSITGTLTGYDNNISGAGKCAIRK